MTRIKSRVGIFGLAALATALMLLVAGCANSAGASEDTTAPGSIAVSLGEGNGSMYLTPAVTSTDAGTVTFVVTNDGAAEHEFVVLSTDLAAKDLPYDASAAEAEEEGDGITPVDEIGSIMPGETLSLTVDLPAGHYVLICNLPGHYQMGMRADFTTH
jgi:uncharacterized cupredoxin-like copper-binding protein